MITIRLHEYSRSLLHSVDRVGGGLGDYQQLVFRLFSKFSFKRIHFHSDEQGAYVLVSTTLGIHFLHVFSSLLSTGIFTGSHLQNSSGFGAAEGPVQA